jgi:hypothetical protein
MSMPFQFNMDLVSLWVEDVDLIMSLYLFRPAWGEGTRGTPIRVALDGIDVFLNLSFLLECVSKVTAYSFREYIKSGWNKLDFLIVFTSTLDMALTYGDFMRTSTNADLTVNVPSPVSF